jgi:GT2 family glycosyltransferase
LEASLQLDSDWVWVSDDDAYPEKSAIENSIAFLRKKELRLNEISAICGTVINNGTIDLFHRRRTFSKHGKIYSIAADSSEYEKPFFEINTFSYVGTIISKEKLRMAGLPQKDFFIFCDDSEHSLRLSKFGKIYCVPSIKINHDQDLADLKGKGNPSWKTYYGIRNSLIMYSEFFPKLCVFNYYWHMRLASLIRFFSSARRPEGKMIRQALKDGRAGKLGINSIYKPGWKPTSNQN